MDCALHRCGVTFVLDRAGVTGDDGASHNGMWDMSVLQVVPGLRLAAPRDGARLRELLGEAVEVDDAPTVVRFPKGPPPDDIPAVGRAGGVDVLRPQRHPRRPRRRRRLRWPPPPSRWRSGWSPRASASPSSTRAGSSRSTRRSSTSRATTAWSSTSRTTAGSAAAAPGLLQELNDAGVTTPFRLHGIPQEFLDHAKRAVILERIGLDAQTLARGIVEDVTALAGAHPALDVDHAALRSGRTTCGGDSRAVARCCPRGGAGLAAADGLHRQPVRRPGSPDQPAEEPTPRRRVRRPGRAAAGAARPGDPRRPAAGASSPRPSAGDGRRSQVAAFEAPRRPAGRQLRRTT